MAAGRKKEFNQELALEKAIEIFWQNGYSGTSLSDLTAGMNINKPSLYATFGNKEELFIAAIKYYLEHYAAAHQASLHAQGLTLEEKIRSSLFAVIDLVADPTLPGGCLMIMSLSESAGDALPKQAIAEIKNVFESSKEAMIAFFANEQKQGNLSSEVAATVLAGNYMTLQMGIASMGRQGVGKSELKLIIEQAIKSFPCL